VNYCTETDWHGGKCLDICPAGKTKVSSCDGTATSERWCCGDSDDCCSANVGFVTLKQVFEATLSGPTTSSSEASASVSEPAVSLGAAASHAGKINGSIIAGAVIGTTIGLLVLLAIVCVSRRKSLKRANAFESTENGKTGSEEVDEGLKAEVDGASQRHELSQSMDRSTAQELSGLSPGELSASTIR
jgi:hypothetical protein